MDKYYENIYKLILKYQFPIYRESNPVKKFLQKYYDDYIYDIEKMADQADGNLSNQEFYCLPIEQVHIIKSICSDIINLLELYDLGDMGKFAAAFSQMMEILRTYLPITNLTSFCAEFGGNLYRIRAGENVNSRENLFHIPLSLRHLIKSYRYSVPGFPCLYLATGVQLCWFECGMPKNFYCSRFNVVQNATSTINLIDFTDIPNNFVADLKLILANHPEKKPEIEEVMYRYLVVLPLKAACSLAVKNKDVSFVEEYIIPQQLIVYAGRTSG